MLGSVVLELDCDAGGGTATPQAACGVPPASPVEEQPGWWQSIRNKGRMPMTDALPGVTRRSLLALTAALLLAVSLPGQALAAESESFKFKGEGAFAQWSLEDARNTEAFVSALDGERRNPPDQPETIESVFVFVTQEFCDEEADERVFRSFFAFDQPATIDINRGLTEGSADAGLSLDGSEFRAPDCEDPNFEEGESTDLGTFEGQLAGSWQGSGKINTSNSVFHFRDEEFTFHSTDVQRSRDAEATGTLSGLEDVGVPSDLGTTQEAELASFNDSTVTIER